MQRLRNAVRRALEAQGLLKPEAKLLSAVSGGADSVGLLWALASLRETAGYRLAALHVQHGLRGERSREDERFVRELCAALGVPLWVEEAQGLGRMDDAGVETRARAQRLALYEKTLRQAGADALLVGHHRDDQAETLLLRLLRGAGGAGLSGMRPAAPFGGGVMLRPFLDLGHADIVSALSGMGIPWREDESNARPCTPRNALRLTVLPRLEALSPGAAERMGHTAESLAADEAYLSAQAGALYERALAPLAPLWALERPAVAGAPEALRRRALRRWYDQGAAALPSQGDERALSHADTLALSALAQSREGALRNLPLGLRARVGRTHLFLERQDGLPLLPRAAFEPLALRADASQYALWGMRVRQTRAAAGQPAPSDAFCAVVPIEVLAQRPVFRRAQKGDVMRPLGAPGGKPLRRLWTDWRVDLALRPLWCVLAAGSRVLWVPGLATAEELRATRVCPGALVLEVEHSFLTNASEGE